MSITLRRIGIVKGSTVHLASSDENWLSLMVDYLQRAGIDTYQSKAAANAISIKTPGASGYDVVLSFNRRDLPDKEDIFIINP